MGEVIGINENKPHISGPVVCMNCKHEWVGVAPAGTYWLECKQCGTFKGVFKGAIQCDCMTWECNCGNTLFEICPDGIHCPNCGVMQEFGDFYE